MSDEEKTRDQLIAELQSLRRKAAQYDAKGQNCPQACSSEECYRALFEDAPVSLWEEDFSETKALLEQLRRQGVSDFHAYFTQQPEVMETCLRTVKVLWVNRAASALFGAQSLPELLERLPQTFTEDGLLTFQHALTSLAEGRPLFEEETTMRTLQGELRHVLMRSFASPADITFSHVIVVMIDITKQKQAEEQLRESEEKLRSFIEQSHDGIRLVNSEGIILLWNNSMERMTGFTQAKVLGKYIWDVIFDMIPEEKRSPVLYERIKTHSLDVCTTGNTSWLQPSVEYEMQRADGTRGMLQTTLFPIRTDSSTMVGSIVRDVTERKQAEKQIRESEEKFRLIAENTSDGIIVFEQERVVYTSPAYNRMMEIPEHSINRLGSAEIAALIHPDDCERIFTNIYAAIAQKRDDLRYAYRITTGTGKLIWREDHARFIYDQEGRHQKSYVVCRDITERVKSQEEARQREQRIQRANKLASLGVLVSGIAHEINNPNNFISLNIATLRKYLADFLPLIDAYVQERQAEEFAGLPYPEFRKELFELMEDIDYGSQRIKAIVSNLREYSYQSAERQWKWVEIPRVIEKAYLLCQGKLRKTVASFDAQFPELLEPVYTDPDALEQIVVNLLINAAQAMDKPDSHILVCVTANTPTLEHVQIEIRDNGCGIEQARLEKIFDPFYTTKPLGEGIGLGLYICHNLLAGIGGKLEIESQPGIGSIFRILLTRAAKEVTP